MRKQMGMHAITKKEATRGARGGLSAAQEHGNVQLVKISDAFHGALLFFNRCFYYSTIMGEREEDIIKELELELFLHFRQVS